VKNKLKVVELFAGVGSQRMALNNIGVEHEVVAISEFDKYAIKSYEAIHGQVNNLGDITKIEELPSCDFLTYSFPCTDISVAGRMDGLEKGSGTRSGLLWEVERLLLNYKQRNELPKYLMLENVKNLVGKKFKKDFDLWINVLNELGYNSYYKVLNAKDYGVPQNRERIFVISILKEYDNGYEFPNKKELRMELSDILLNDVEEKYYMSHSRALELINMVKEDKLGRFPTVENKPLISSALSSREHRGSGWKEISGTLCARDYKDPKVVAVPIDSTTCNPKELKVANCITARYDAGIQNKQSIGVAVVEKTVCEQRTDEGLRFFNNNVCGILKTIDSCGDKRVLESDEYNFKLRKLTPLECWRLMGFSDEDFYKAEKVNSNTQLYKQAGNSIVVNVLEGLYKNLFNL